MPDKLLLLKCKFAPIFIWSSAWLAKSVTAILYSNLIEKCWMWLNIWLTICVTVLINKNLRVISRKLLRTVLTLIYLHFNSKFVYQQITFKVNILNHTRSHHNSIVAFALFTQQISSKSRFLENQKIVFEIQVLQIIKTVLNIPQYLCTWQGVSQKLWKLVFEGHWEIQSIYLKMIFMMYEYFESACTENYSEANID